MVIIVIAQAAELAHSRVINSVAQNLEGKGGVRRGERSLWIFV